MPQQFSGQLAREDRIIIQSRQSHYGSAFFIDPRWTRQLRRGPTYNMFEAQISKCLFGLFQTDWKELRLPFFRNGLTYLSYFTGCPPRDHSSWCFNLHAVSARVLSSAPMWVFCFQKPIKLETKALSCWFLITLHYGSNPIFRGSRSKISLISLICNLKKTCMAVLSISIVGRRRGYQILWPRDCTPWKRLAFIWEGRFFRWEPLFGMVPCLWFEMAGKFTSMCATWILISKRISWPWFDRGMAIRHEIRTNSRGGAKIVNLTPIRAIRTFCLECVCWSPCEVRECTDGLCPLYPFRLAPFLTLCLWWF